MTGLPARTLRTGNRRRRHFAAVAILVVLGTSACSDANRRRIEAEAAALTGGSPSRGVTSMQRYGCGSCHSIPGVRGASSLVGPPLKGISQRMYLAGVVANTPENMIRWIMSPPSIDSLTAMPEMGVSERDARDIAAYLYTLR